MTYLILFWFLTGSFEAAFFTVNYFCDLQTILKEQQEHLVEEREQSEKALANISNALAEKERELQRVLALTRDEDVRSAQEELEEAEASFSPSQMHKSTDIESEDETNVPQYSTFPRTSREKTLLPPIKPPRRVKKADIRKAKVAMSSKSCSLESITNTQVTAEVGFKGRNRSLQDITAEGLTGSFLMISPDRNERAPTPIPNSKREANSTKKPYMNYLSTAEVNKCQTPPENVCKPAVRGWRSQPESLRKPRWLTELSVRVNESSRNRPLSFPIKRSILYWDNINPKLQLKFSS
ncbi:hypothetical protein R5R35_009677 [Gryllus longicercus]|uniref:Accessory gland protein n=1 Tax=Gryllus longicercus TaxID=2509291 RepID=A0AAN9V4A2_9ORTH